MKLNLEIAEENPHKADKANDSILFQMNWKWTALRIFCLDDKHLTEHNNEKWFFFWREGGKIHCIAYVIRKLAMS